MIQRLSATRELREHALDLQRAFDAEAADLVRRAAGDIVAVEEHAAAVGRQQARDQIEERGLAGAVRPDDGVQRARRRDRSSGVDGGEAAEALAEFFGAQDRLGHGSVRSFASRPRAQHRAR